MKHCYLILLVLLTPSILSAQIINIDRENSQDSVTKRWEISTLIDFSSDKQVKDLLDLSIKSSLLTKYSNKYALNFIVNNDIVLDGKSTLQNEGMLHLRYRDLDSRKVSSELYLQYQWNGAWGMISRYVLGSNIRYKIFDETSTDFYIGLGLFYENERWNWEGVEPDITPVDAGEETRQVFRLNNYWKTSKKLSDFADIAAITYFQFPFNQNFLKPRWYFEVNTYFKASKHLNLVIHWDHVLDFAPLMPIDHFYYSYSTGLQLNF